MFRFVLVAPRDTLWHQARTNIATTHNVSHEYSTLSDTRPGHTLLQHTMHLMNIQHSATPGLDTRRYNTRCISWIFNTLWYQAWVHVATIHNIIFWIFNTERHKAWLLDATIHQYIGWRWHNFVPYLCQLVFATILWEKFSEMFVTLTSLKNALLVS